MSELTTTKPNGLPLTSDNRRRILVELMSIPMCAFKGSISDFHQMGETWMERIGYEDEWLLRLAERNGIL